MNFNLIMPETKISKYFHPYNQAVMDELIGEFLSLTAEDYETTITGLFKELGTFEIRRLITIFKETVEETWRINENKN